MLHVYAFHLMFVLHLMFVFGANSEVSEAEGPKGLFEFSRGICDALQRERHFFKEKTCWVSHLNRHTEHVAVTIQPSAGLSFFL